MKLFFSFFLIVSFFSPLPLMAEQPDEHVKSLIKQGDINFNGENYKKSFDFYARAYNLIKNDKSSYPAIAQLINNMAAVHMALGNTKEFHRFFLAVRRIARKIFPLSENADEKDNLIINGGFEKGLVLPWGTGHYERPDGKFRFGIWWNSMNARAFMKIDTAIKHSGENSLRITDYSPSAPHVFTTLSQRIKPAVPNSLYEISCYVKAENLKPGAVNFALDAAWAIRTKNFPAGTYGWKLFKDTVNIGHNNYIDLRILRLQNRPVPGYSRK